MSQVMTSVGVLPVMQCGVSTGSHPQPFSRPATKTGLICDVIICLHGHGNKKIIYVF